MQRPKGGGGLNVIRANVARIYEHNFLGPASTRANSYVDRYLTFAFYS